MITSKPVLLARTTVTASAVNHLREEIITGRLLPGEALPEARVGELLGVSRAPVREALTLLEREGLVTFDRRGTARVCILGPDDIQELALMRLAIEPTAAKLACERLTPFQIAEIANNLDQMKKADSLSAVTRMDMDFYRLILKATGNKRLQAAWEGMAGQLLLVMTGFHQTMEKQTPTVREFACRRHTELFNQFIGRDPIKAEATARNHALGWRNWLEEMVANNKEWEAPQ